jgi:hypothetical protein
MSFNHTSARLGVQTIRWQAQDPSGNTARIAITVDVVSGSQPVIILNGDLNQKWEAGVAYVDPGGTISDPFEGDLSQLLSSDASEKVDVSNPGTYTVTYFMTSPDAQNLLASSKTRTVTVADTIKPVREEICGGS